MKVIGPRRDAPVAEGWHQAVATAVVNRQTQQGELEFLLCRITSPGKDKDREVSFLVPRYVGKGTYFHRLLVSILGSSLGVGKDVDPKILVNKAVAIRVARVRKGKRTYANVVALALPETSE